MIFEMVIFILGGAVVTLAVTLIALPMGLVLGTGFALMRVYGGKIPGLLAAFYSNVMRGVPPIVLLFILYFIIAGLSTFPLSGQDPWRLVSSAVPTRWRSSGVPSSVLAAVKRWLPGRLE